MTRVDGAIGLLLGAILAARAGEAGQSATAPGAAAAPSDPAATLSLPFAFDGPRPPVPPAVIARDASDRVTVRAVRLTSPLRIDGHLDEAIYTNVPPMSEFIQVEPDGGQPATEDVPKIQAPLLIHYAELDTRVNAGWPAYEQALKDNKKDYTAYIYPGVNHGFNNDTTPRYDKAAADLAWGRTIEFFKGKLG